MEFNIFSGKDFEIGRKYGAQFAEKIRYYLPIFVHGKGNPPLPLDDHDFKKWVDDQEKVISTHWPWLIEEMRGVADGSGSEYRDILLLNLRAWQYNFYSGKAVNPATNCSSLIIALTDGSAANIGALDDCIEVYCGMIKMIPDCGYSYMSFPIAGTSWGNRGMNSVGLCVGASSQIFSGLKRLPGSICADVANRVILQTCATVADVREFCRQHPFTLNLACSDKNGDVFCAHQTTAGLFEVADRAPCAITNHVVDDLLRFKLSTLGAVAFPEDPTTRLRRGRLMDFAKNNNGRINAGELRKFIADRMEGSPSSTCPKNHNIVLTYANPQAEPGVMWIAEPQTTNDEIWMKYEI